MHRTRQNAHLAPGVHAQTASGRAYGNRIGGRGGIDWDDWLQRRRGRGGKGSERINTSAPGTTASTMPLGLPWG